MFVDVLLGEIDKFYGKFSYGHQIISVDSITTYYHRSGYTRKLWYKLSGM